MERPEITAPGLKWRPRSNRWVPYWTPRSDAVAQGYPSGSVNLEPYLATPDLLADRCLKLQTDMLLWLDGLRHRVGLFDHTIGSVLSIYQTHPESLSGSSSVAAVSPTSTT